MVEIIDLKQEIKKELDDIILCFSKDKKVYYFVANTLIDENTYPIYLNETFLDDNFINDSTKLKNKNTNTNNEFKTISDFFDFIDDNDIDEKTINNVNLNYSVKNLLEKIVNNYFYINNINYIEKKNINELEKHFYKESKCDFCKNIFKFVVNNLKNSQENNFCSGFITDEIFSIRTENEITKMLYNNFNLENDYSKPKNKFKM